MSEFTIIRTDREIPADMQPVRDLLFGVFDGFNKEDKRAWRKFWKRLFECEPGEMIRAMMVFPRLGPYHRRHLKIERSVFDAQERFTSFEQFRNWVKIGAGWVDWFPGAKGGIVPIPRSISYAKADQAEFEKYHEGVMWFLREGHAARFLWKHLGDGADEMMDAILVDFDRDNRGAPPVGDKRVRNDEGVLEHAA